MSKLRELAAIWIGVALMVAYHMWPVLAAFPDWSCATCGRMSQVPLTTIFVYVQLLAVMGIGISLGALASTEPSAPFLFIPVALLMALGASAIADELVYGAEFSELVVLMAASALPAWTGWLFSRNMRGRQIDYADLVDEL